MQQLVCVGRPMMALANAKAINTFEWDNKLAAEIETKSFEHRLLLACLVACMCLLSMAILLLS